MTQTILMTFPICDCKECRTIDYDSVTVDELLGVVRYTPKKIRRVIWMKKVRKSTVSAGWNGESIISDFSDFGLERVEGHAAFDDGGKHIVIETVDGLEWTIIDADANRSIMTVKLDFDEAVAQCKLLNQSEKEIWGTTQKAPTPKTRQGFFRRLKAV